MVLVLDGCVDIASDSDNQQQTRVLTFAWDTWEVVVSTVVPEYRVVSRLMIDLGFERRRPLPSVVVLFDHCQREKETYIYRMWRSGFTFPFSFGFFLPYRLVLARIKTRVSDPGSIFSLVQS